MLSPPSVTLPGRGKVKVRVKVKVFLLFCHFWVSSIISLPVIPECIYQESKLFKGKSMDSHFLVTPATFEPFLACPWMFLPCRHPWMVLSGVHGFQSLWIPPSSSPRQSLSRGLNYLRTWIPNKRFWEWQMTWIPDKKSQAWRNYKREQRKVAINLLRGWGGRVVAYIFQIM